YQFDDYGEDAVLALELIVSILPPETTVFYPAQRPCTVTASTRGFVILANPKFAERLASLSDVLQPWCLTEALVQQTRYHRRLLKSARQQGVEGAEAAAAEVREAIRQDITEVQTAADLAIEEVRQAAQKAVEHTKSAIGVLRKELQA